MAKITELHNAVRNAQDEVFYWATSSHLTWHTECHSHASGQLFCLDSGLATMETDNTSWILLPGRVGWIPPASTHSMRSFQQVTGWSLYLPARCAKVLPEVPTIFIRSALLEQLVARVAQWQTEPPSEAVRNRLLAVLCDEIHISRTGPFHLRSPTDPRLRALIETLVQDPSLELALDDCARQVGMSKRSLTRGFQQQTGLSFGQWQQKFRVLAAMERLDRKSVV